MVVVDKETICDIETQITSVLVVREVAAQEGYLEAWMAFKISIQGVNTGVTCGLQLSVRTFQFGVLPSLTCSFN